MSQDIRAFTVYYTKYVVIINLSVYFTNKTLVLHITGNLLQTNDILHIPIWKRYLLLRILENVIFLLPKL